MLYVLTSTLSAEDDGFGSEVACTDRQKIQKYIIKVIESLQAQAYVIKQLLTEQKFSLIAIGKTVTIPISLRKSQRRCL